MLFDQVDAVLAFAVIMLLLSLLITAMVQLLVSVTGLRGRNLVWAVEQLFRQIAPKLEDDEHPDAAAFVARQVLGNRVWATSTNYVAWLFDAIVNRFTKKHASLRQGRRPPTHIRKADLALVLETMVANGDLTQAVEKRLPDQAKSVEKVVNDTLAAKATVEQGLDDWFDLVMTAASEKFKLWSRWFTVAGALVLAFGMQVNAIDLFRQLSNDPALRAEVLKQAPAALALLDDAKAEATAAPPAESAEAKKGVEALRIRVRAIEAELGRTGIVVLRPWTGGLPGWSAFWGMVASALLLSLGAPFWYGVLRGLLRLRSTIAEAPGAGS